MLTLSISVFAQDVEPLDNIQSENKAVVNDTGSVAQQLTKLKSDVLLLNAKAKKAEALKRLNDASGENHSFSSGFVAPVIKSIYGNGTHLIAEIECADGNVIDVKPGDKNICGIDIVNIVSTMVSMRAGDQVYNIPVKHCVSTTNQQTRAEKNNTNYIPKPRFK